ncbi:Hsp70 family protein [Nocardia gipuzkoensis]|uniref:Hsp70 family protein n=1 Tax=Nocardia gipuzkoensis TaxID=2749991 RepID=UPI003EE0FBE3
MTDTISFSRSRGWVLSVDFGTTATSAAVRESSGAVLGVVLPDGASTMPSSVFAEDSGQLLVGAQADNTARFGLDRYEPTPKRRVGRRLVPLGNRDYRPAELIAAVYAAICGEAIRQHNHTPPAELVLTHPVAWREPHLLVLREAAGLAAAQLPVALPEPVFVPEPVAAASWYTRAHPAAGGQCFAVYDLGGGTFDATVLRYGNTGFEVLARGGIDPLGGFDFDTALFTYLGATHVNEADPRLWATLSTPNFDDPDADDRRRGMQTLVRQLKEDLSTHTSRTVRLPGVRAPVLVTRENLEALIAPDLEATLTELQATIKRAELAPEQLTGIFRIGGASRTPLVGELLDRLRIPVHTVDHPKTVVTLGAATPLPASTRQTCEPVDRSREKFERAAAAQRAGDHVTAIAGYQQVVELADSHWAPYAAYNLGEIHFIAMKNATARILQTSLHDEQQQLAHAALDDAHDHRTQARAAYRTAVHGNHKELAAKAAARLDELKTPPGPHVGRPPTPTVTRRPAPAAFGAGLLLLGVFLIISQPYLSQSLSDRGIFIAYVSQNLVWIGLDATALTAGMLLLAKYPPSTYRILPLPLLIALLFAVPIGFLPAELWARYPTGPLVVGIPALAAAAVSVAAARRLRNHPPAARPSATSDPPAYLSDTDWIKVLIGTALVTTGMATALMLWWQVG